MESESTAKEKSSSMDLSGISNARGQDMEVREGDRVEANYNYYVNKSRGALIRCRCIWWQPWRLRRKDIDAIV